MTHNTESCVYCGVPFDNANRSKDHIPAKIFFPSPRPCDLITVPCCRPCNQERSADDFHAALMLLINSAVRRTEVIKQLTKRVLNSLARPESTGLRLAISGGIKIIDVFTESGLFIGQRPALRQNVRRIEDTISCYIKGLFFHEYGFRLQDEYGADSRIVLTLSEEQVASVLVPVSSLATASWTREWSGVFAYKTQAAEDDPNITAWIIRFFDSIDFLCVTLPLEDLRMNY